MKCSGYITTLDYTVIHYITPSLSILNKYYYILFDGGGDGVVYSDNDAFPV